MGVEPASGVKCTPTPSIMRSDDQKSPPDETISTEARTDFTGYQIQPLMPPVKVDLSNAAKVRPASNNRPENNKPIDLNGMNGQFGIGGLDLPDINPNGIFTMTLYSMFSTGLVSKEIENYERAKGSAGVGISALLSPYEQDNAAIKPSVYIGIFSPLLFESVPWNIGHEDIFSGLGLLTDQLSVTQDTCVTIGLSTYFKLNTSGISMNYIRQSHSSSGEDTLFTKNNNILNKTDVSGWQTVNNLFCKLNCGDNNSVIVGARSNDDLSSVSPMLAYKTNSLFDIVTGFSFSKAIYGSDIFGVEVDLSPFTINYLFAPQSYDVHTISVGYQVGFSLGEKNNS